MASRRVLITGAGIAGPTLAYWLDRYGMEPTVLERAPELRLGGQNVDVRGAGRVVVARTGIEEAVRAAGTGERGLAFVDGSGAVQAEFPVTSGDGSAGDGPTAELEILRGDLGQILFEHTADRVPYRFGDHVVALDDDGRRVRVGVEHGPEEEFDLVVAADGVRSGTREIAMPGRADIRFLGLCMAYFTIPRDDTDTDWWRLVRRRRGAHDHPASGPARHDPRAAVVPVAVVRARPDEPRRSAGAAAGGVHRRRLAGRPGARRTGARRTSTSRPSARSGPRPSRAAASGSSATRPGAPRRSAGGARRWPCSAPTCWPVSWRATTTTARRSPPTSR